MLERGNMFQGGKCRTQFPVVVGQFSLVSPSSLWEKPRRKTLQIEQPFLACDLWCRMGSERIVSGKHNLFLTTFRYCEPPTSQQTTWNVSVVFKDVMYTANLYYPIQSRGYIYTESLQSDNHALRRHEPQHCTIRWGHREGHFFISLHCIRPVNNSIWQKTFSWQNIVLRTTADKRTSNNPGVLSLIYTIVAHNCYHITHQWDCLNVLFTYIYETKKSRREQKYC